MRLARMGILVWTVLAASLAVGADGGEAFRVEALAEGVHLFTPIEGDPRLVNSLVVELPEGLMVVDAQPTVAAARRLLAAIGTRFEMPVRFLVMTHPHADAVGGAPAFSPGAVRLASTAAMEQLQDPEASFDAESPPSAGGEARERSLPTAAVGGTLIFPTPAGEVVLRAAGRAHSGGDLVVLFPGRGIVALGDLASLTVPPFSEEGSLSGWVTVLGAMVRERPEKVVPLRGPVMSLPQLRERQHALAYLTNQIGAAFTEGVSAAEIPDWVFEQESFSDWFGDPAEARSMRSLIEIGVEEKLIERRKRGIHD